MIVIGIQKKFDFVTTDNTFLRRMRAMSQYEGVMALLYTDEESVPRSRSAGDWQITPWAVMRKSVMNGRGPSQKALARG